MLTFDDENIYLTNADGETFPQPYRISGNSLTLLGEGEPIVLTKAN